MLKVADFLASAHRKPNLPRPRVTPPSCKEVAAAAPEHLVAISKARPSRPRPASGSVGTTASMQAWPDERSFVPSLPELVAAEETWPPAVAILVLKTEVTGVAFALWSGCSWVVPRAMNYLMCEEVGGRHKALSISLAF